ncbi:uncharacterized protein RCC_08959 [Ramularia collo-cygni]|uniref:Uncharacterized protein n=1 Tax=Ramularia collo-cygni TaxID=112498 RepID=A0A2D3VND5_9PEZI|nr:uncharacterized protein RCC_08959 [Ramularia collo-cygni]CZT23248.1 uncharacterized protein RCC_08959 [Ramularia collo-cygni]
MSSRLMKLPAELRVRIYEYTFGDSVPDEVGVYVGSEADDAGGESAALEESAVSDQSIMLGKKEPRQIDLLKAKDHYPQTSLLVTCKLIYKEAGPVFEAAAKVFWDIDVFNINLAEQGHYLAESIGDFLEQMGIIGAKLRSMSVLRKHGLKGFRCSWPSVCFTMRADEDGVPFVLHSGSTARTLPYKAAWYARSLFVCLRRESPECGLLHILELFTSLPPGTLIEG